MNLLVFVFVLTQVIHILLDAFFAASNVNTAWQTMTHYLFVNGKKLITQVIVSVGFFMLIANNPAAADAIGIPWLNLLVTKVGGAIILGWFFDSFLDKILGFWNLKKEV